ncbi:M17 family peptidase N-terminal domain-containing protein, partial [Leptospira sp. SA-E8]|uniref:M17 family peptidase N-terminal domain-containing protein n=1 Tax=Leptospira sp. SA-E8 TaxID=3422259 RepID=UPI003EBB7A1F
MNFDLLISDLNPTARQGADALIVLLQDGFKPQGTGKDAATNDLDTLIAQALKAGDIQSQAGKLLALYRPAQAKAARVLLAGIGAGTPRQVRQAVGAALGALRSGAPALKKITICFATAPATGAVRAAVQTAADASYVYTT